MKINKKSNKKRAVIITIVVAILLTTGSIAAYLILNKDDSGKQNTTSTDIQKIRHNTSNNSEKSSSKPTQDISTNVDTKKQPQNTDLPPVAPIDDSTGKKQLQVVSQYDISSGNIYIRGGINNTIVRDGSCVAILKGPNGQVIEKPTSLLPNPSTTDCKTITIPLSELTSGNWRYTLSYTSPNAEGASSEKMFTVQ